MADNETKKGEETKKAAEPVVLKEGEVAVSAKTLEAIQEQMATMATEIENEKLKRAGLEEMFAAESGKTTEPGLREKKNTEPTFRTVSLRKYDPAHTGDPESEKFIIGWTPRGAYRKAVDNGLGGKEFVEYLDVIFLDSEKVDGKVQAIAVPALDVMNSGRRVVCRVLDIKDYKGQSFKPTYPQTGQAERKVGTGEEISVTTWDPKHGLVDSGEVIDGWVAFSDLTFIVQIPGRTDPLEIDQRFVNM